MIVPLIPGAQTLTWPEVFLISAFLFISIGGMVSARWLEKDIDRTSSQPTMQDRPAHANKGGNAKDRRRCQRKAARR